MLQLNSTRLRFGKTDRRLKTSEKAKDAALSKAKNYFHKIKNNI